MMLIELIKHSCLWGTWVAQSVKHLTLAQVMISQFLTQALHEALCCQCRAHFRSSVSYSLCPSTPLEACFDYILGLETLDAIAFGMQSVDEVRYNAAKINGEPIEAELAKRVAGAKKSLHISDWCEGCGECAAHCSQKALTIIDGKAQVDHSKCLTCCYCAAYCPLFCIKVI